MLNYIEIKLYPIYTLLINQSLQIPCDSRFFNVLVGSSYRLENHREYTFRWELHWNHTVFHSYVFF